MPLGSSGILRDSPGSTGILPGFSRDSPDSFGILRDSFECSGILPEFSGILVGFSAVCFNS